MGFQGLCDIAFIYKMISVAGTARIKTSADSGDGDVAAAAAFAATVSATVAALAAAAAAA